jgi:RNA polymerase primary sigma factor
MIDEDKCFEFYCESVGQHELLSRKEEQELFKVFHKWSNNKKAGQATRKNGKAAREKLINSNLRLVIKIARDYSGCGLPLLDLISEGNIGLMTAVDRYESDKGAKLSTYAALWIRQKIIRSLNNKGHLIRVPVAANAKYLKIIKYINQQKEEHGEEPSEEDIIKKFKVTAAALKRCREVRGTMFSIDRKQGESNSPEGEGKSFEETIGDMRVTTPDQDAELSDNKWVLKQFLNSLDRREKYILSNRFGLANKETQTLEDIGDKLKVTRERVRQIERAALRKLRRMVTTKYRISSDEQTELVFKF